MSARVVRRLGGFYGQRVRRCCGVYVVTCCVSLFVTEIIAQMRRPDAAGSAGGVAGVPLHSFALPDELDSGRDLPTAGRA